MPIGEASQLNKLSVEHNDAILLIYICIQHFIPLFTMEQ
jgi:hypothetical protein